jgi:hypothetical protein
MDKIYFNRNFTIKNNKALKRLIKAFLHPHIITVKNINIDEESKLQCDLLKKELTKNIK